MYIYIIHDFGNGIANDVLMAIKRDDYSVHHVAVMQGSDDLFLDKITPAQRVAG